MASTNATAASDNRLPVAHPSSPVDCSVAPQDIRCANLRHKGVIITGGAAGLGRAYVEAFAAAGAFVTFGDVNEHAGRELEATRPGTKFVRCDVRSWNDQVRLFECALTHSPYISCDVVVANAGVSQPDGVDIWDDPGSSPIRPNTTRFDVNLVGQLYTAKLAVHYFRRSPSRAAQDRCLILVSSIGGYLDIPGYSMYSMTKFASRGLMRSLRRSTQLGENRVNIVAPWYIRTASFGPEAARRLLDSGATFARSEDASNAVLRIASDPSINGRAIAVVPPDDECPHGYLDLGQDDLAPGTVLQKWQRICINAFQ